MIKRALLIAVMAVSLAACTLPVPPFAPAATATPTRTHRPRHTRTPTPTITPEPTRAPTELPFAILRLTPSLTPGLPFTLLTSTAPVRASASATLPPPQALDCKLIWQSPPNGSLYYVGNKFSVGWNLKNIGTATWEPGSFEFMYVGGAKLASDDRVPLDRAVPPGQEIVLSVPMRAPMTPSDYTTHWGIRQGEAGFCRLTLTIRVKP